MIRRIINPEVRKNTLLIRVRWGDGNEIKKSLGYRVNAEYWNGESLRDGTMHGKHGEIPAELINIRLGEVRNKLNRLFIQSDLSNTMPTKEEVMKAIIPEQPEAVGEELAKTSLSRLYPKFVKDGAVDNGWSLNTVKSVNQVGTLIMKFDRRAKIEDVDETWLKRFANWQRSHRLRQEARFGHPGYANNVIEKHMRVVKWFLKWATKNRYTTREKWENYQLSVKKIARPVIFLIWEELMKFWNADLEEGSMLDKVRDFFCFQAFTSLRFSDAINLKRFQVSYDALHIVTQKTSTLLTIELNKYSRAIVEKYSGQSGEFVLPRLALDKYDRVLKDLGKMLDISEPIGISQFYGSNRMDKAVPKYQLLSSHAARRTFICNALAMGIAPNVVMKWTGHSEYSAMKPYIDIADEIKRNSMGLFDRL